MRHFKDADGRSWNIAINVNLIELVQSRLDIDIADMYFETGSRVFASSPLLVRLLYVVCEKQIEAARVTPESMVGDALEHGALALMEAIADFFPTRKRKMLEAQLAKAREIEQATINETMKRLGELTPEKFFTSLKNSAGSSRSTRGRSRSAG